jgi:hypothetical protein
MLAKCANPECCAEFRYLRQGKLFLREPGINSPTRAKSTRGVLQRYWLCSSCCESFTVVDDGERMRVVPLGVRLHGNNHYRKAS